MQGSSPMARDEARLELTGLLDGNLGDIPVEVLVPRLMEGHADGGWPVLRAAGQALSRRIDAAAREELRVARRMIHGRRAAGSASSKALASPAPDMPSLCPNMPRALALVELVLLVDIGDQSDHAGMDDSPLYDDVHGVDALDHGGCHAPARQEAVVHEVEAAAFALHEAPIVKDAGEVIVAAAARVEDVRRGDAQREAAGIDDLEAIRVEVEEDVAPLV